MGSLISLYKEIKSNKIFNFKDFERITSARLIEKFKFEDGAFISDDFFFLSEFLKKQTGKKVYFISLVKTDYDLTEKLKGLLSKEYKIEKEIELSLSVSKLKNVVKEDIFLLFSSAESNTFKSVEDFMRKLSLMNIQLSGNVFLENIESN